MAARAICTPRIRTPGLTGTSTSATTSGRPSPPSTSSCAGSGSGAGSNPSTPPTGPRSSGRPGPAGRAEPASPAGGETHARAGVRRQVRPSTFLTLTLDSYGRVDGDGAALDPGSYDYRRAARDAIHFPKIVDRVLAEHPALRRLGRPVLRHHRAAEAWGAAPPRRDPRHHPARRTPRHHRRDLPPGVVAGPRRAAQQR